SIFNPASLPTRIAAEVNWDSSAAELDDPRTRVYPIRDRKISFALHAAQQAYDSAIRCGSVPTGEGGLSLGIGLELFSMEDASAKRRGEPLPLDPHERMGFLQTPS